MNVQLIVEEEFRKASETLKPFNLRAAFNSRYARSSTLRNVKNRQQREQMTNEAWNRLTVEEKEAIVARSFRLSTPAVAAPSAYALFTRYTPLRASLHGEAGQITMALNECWNSMDDGGKKEYEEMSAAIKRRLVTFAQRRRHEALQQCKASPTTTLAKLNSNSSSIRVDRDEKEGGEDLAAAGDGGDENEKENDAAANGHIATASSIDKVTDQTLLSNIFNLAELALTIQLINRALIVKTHEKQVEGAGVNATASDESNADNKHIINHSHDKRTMLQYNFKQQLLLHSQFSSSSSSIDYDSMIFTTLKAAIALIDYESTLPYEKHGNNNNDDSKDEDDNEALLNKAIKFIADVVSRQVAATMSATRWRRATAIVDEFLHRLATTRVLEDSIEDEASKSLPLQVLIDVLSQSPLFVQSIRSLVDCVVAPCIKRAKTQLEIAATVHNISHLLYVFEEVIYARYTELRLLKVNNNDALGLRALLHSTLLDPRFKLAGQYILLLIKII